MMIRKTALFIFSFTLVFLNGCSTKSDTDDLTKIPVVIITGVEVKPLDQDGNNHFYTDTLRNQFRFSVYTEYEIIGYEEVQTVIEEHDQDKLPGVIANPTHPEYASIQFNKPIGYQSRPIEPGMNLFEDEEIMDSFDGAGMDLLFNPHLSPFAIGQIVFKKAAFYVEPGEYQIEVTWGNDEELFHDSVQVYLDLY